MADRLVVLRAGRVEQIGTPQELHTRPATWQVADFMGYRNLLRLRVTEITGGEVTVAGDGLAVRGTPAGPVAAGDAVVAAVRPEHLRIGDPDAPGGVPCTVEVVEYQGREVAIEARTGNGLQLNLRSEHRSAPGDKITVTVDPADLLVYPAPVDCV